MTQKIKSLLSDLRLYWNIPMPNRYMAFKEIAAYAGGGIGAYMIITLGTACLLAATNTLIGDTLGVRAGDTYFMYVLAVLANIPLTGIRANIIDNTRNKAGKYRPYIVTMAVPTAIICVTMVWFPYSVLNDWFGSTPIEFLDGRTGGYIAKCAIIFVLNLLLHFVYYFFYDGYENLIHVLSPNTQERADVTSIKAIVYSFAPTVINLFTPIIAGKIFHTNSTDIRVYRLLYPIIAVIGILLCIVVYKFTEEKIIQARTHVVSVRFIDALRAVAKNKYFWIISLAGWLGFLEGAFANILFWLYNYGGACSGSEYGLIVTVYGNASLWGMLLAPFCIRKWGKKAVLVVTNFFNIAFILLMLPFVSNHDQLHATIWIIMIILYFNALMGSFAHILNPTIQADIRDYQHYKTGERIDGMFSAVGTIGSIITLATASVLPFIYERNGITQENAAIVTSRPEILNRMLGDGKTVGQILAEQLANGQDNYNNAYAALYDPDILISLLKVLIIISAFGALMNVIPYFWYDLSEKRQKGIVKVLQVRALFEDYGNGVLSDERIVEAVDIIREAREKCNLELKSVKKSDYKHLGKEGKMERNLAILENEEIENAQFVCAELDKYTRESTLVKVKRCERVFAAGLDGLKNIDVATVKEELAAAKAMPKGTADEKDLREFLIEMARNTLRAHKTINKHFKEERLVRPEFSELEKLFDKEDECADKIKKLYVEQNEAKKSYDKIRVKELSAEIKALKKVKDEVQSAAKAEMDKHANFNRAAKPFLDAEKLLKEKENFTHLEEIVENYEEAKARAEAERQAKLDEQKRLAEEKEAKTAQLKAEKEAQKLAKKEAKKETANKK